MPIRYKFDIIAALRQKGYNTNYLRKNKVISEGSIQNLRHDKHISLSTLETICELLELQPGDILEYTPKNEENC